MRWRKPGGSRQTAKLPHGSGPSDTPPKLVPRLAREHMVPDSRSATFKPPSHPTTKDAIVKESLQEATRIPPPISEASAGSPVHDPDRRRSYVKVLLLFRDF